MTRKLKKIKYTGIDYHVNRRIATSFFGSKEEEEYAFKGKPRQDYLKSFRKLLK